MISTKYITYIEQIECSSQNRHKVQSTTLQTLRLRYFNQGFLYYYFFCHNCYNYSGCSTIQSSVVSNPSGNPSRGAFAFAPDNKTLILHTNVAAAHGVRTSLRVPSVSENHLFTSSGADRFDARARVLCNYLYGKNTHTHTLRDSETHSRTE